MMSQQATSMLASRCSKSRARVLAEIEGGKLLTKSVVVGGVVDVIVGSSCCCIFVLDLVSCFKVCVRFTTLDPDSLTCGI